MRFLETGIDVRQVSSKSSLHPVEHPFPHVPQSAVRAVAAGGHSEQVLVDGAADVISAGRQWPYDLHLALRPAHALSTDVAWTSQDGRARWH